MFYTSRTEGVRVIQITDSARVSQVHSNTFLQYADIYEKNYYTLYRESQVFFGYTSRDASFATIRRLHHPLQLKARGKIPKNLRGCIGYGPTSNINL